MLLINKVLIKMSKGFRGWIFLIVFFKMVILVGLAEFASIIAGLLGHLLNPSLTQQQFKTAIISVLIASVVMLVAELLVGEAEYYCTAKARIVMRKKLFEKVLELDVSNIEQIGAGVAITSAVDGVEHIQKYYSVYLPTLLYCFLAPTYLFFRLQMLNFEIALILFIASVLYMPLNNLFRGIVEKLKKGYYIAQKELTALYLENINGLTTIELFNKGKDRLKKLKEKADAFCNLIVNIMHINFLSCLVCELLVNSAIFIGVIISGNRLMGGRMEIRTALIILMLSFNFFASLRKLMWDGHEAMNSVAAIHIISDILDINTEKPVTPSEGASVGEGIEAKNVSFAYEGREAVLKDITVNIEKGKTTALVGTSGCGKSTLAGVFMRFFDPSFGTVTLDGRDYKSFIPDELRRHIIMVPQFVYVFSGTIEENLRIGKENATEKELYDVLDKVKLLDWVKAQPKGLQTDVGDAGAMLSGGQRQKIGIARALLREAEYIIFDESTSSVDIESENEIWECIKELEKKCTLIIISHRLSTIRQADKIYVLSKGEVAESGKHDELMAKGGIYSKLVEEQNELETMGKERVSNV